MQLYVINKGVSTDYPSFCICISILIFDFYCILNRNILYLGSGDCLWLQYIPTCRERQDEGQPPAQDLQRGSPNIPLQAAELQDQSWR